MYLSIFENYPFTATTTAGTTTTTTAKAQTGFQKNSLRNIDKMKQMT
jgi:hypothetical protein